MSKHSFLFFSGRLSVFERKLRSENITVKDLWTSLLITVVFASFLTAVWHVPAIIRRCWNSRLPTSRSSAWWNALLEDSLLIIIMNL